MHGRMNPGFNQAKNCNTFLDCLRSLAALKGAVRVFYSMSS